MQFGHSKLGLGLGVLEQKKRKRKREASGTRPLSRQLSRVASHLFVSLSLSLLPSVSFPDSFPLYVSVWTLVWVPLNLCVSMWDIHVYPALCVSPRMYTRVPLVHSHSPVQTLHLQMFHHKGGPTFWQINDFYRSRYAHQACAAQSLQARHLPLKHLPGLRPESYMNRSALQTPTPMGYPASQAKLLVTLDKRHHVGITSPGRPQPPGEGCTGDCGAGQCALQQLCCAMCYAMAVRGQARGYQVELTNSSPDAHFRTAP